MVPKALITHCTHLDSFELG